MGTKVFIVGRQLVDYEDRKTGEPIKGYKVFFFCPSEGVKGYYAASVWVDANRSPDVFGKMSAVTSWKLNLFTALFLVDALSHSLQST